jgi:hypothetical protein
VIAIATRDSNSAERGRSGVGQTFAVGMRKHSMQGLANATVPLFTGSATVPPIPEATPFIMGELFSLFGFTVALVGLVIPMIFYVVWIAVGVAVLIYLRRMLKSP